MKAKYYIYRNLNKGLTFSIKYKGKVILREENIIAKDVEFKVSQTGRKRTLQQKRRNVHAYAVCDNFKKKSKKINIQNKKEIWYNPYKTDSFMIDNKKLFNANHVIFTDGRAWI